MASEDTTTVRIRRPDSERLQALAQQRQTTVIEVLHSAVAVPAGIGVASLVCIGHPGEEKRAYDPGEKLDRVRIRYDHWDNMKQ